VPWLLPLCGHCLLYFTPALATLPAFNLSVVLGFGVSTMCCGVWAIDDRPAASLAACALKLKAGLKVTGLVLLYLAIDSARLTARQRLANQQGTALALALQGST